MKRSHLCIGLVVFWIFASGHALAAARSGPPNIVFVLADDLGYAELGCYGQQKIRTPNVDRLAAQGMRFTRHYAGSPVCAPSRCVLMTGLHSGHNYVRDNSDSPGERGQIPLPPGTVTLASLLKQCGYATGGFGKWGLGGPGSTGDPLKLGFDHFFGYLDQRHAHNYYPSTIFDDGREVPLRNPKFAPYAKLKPDQDPNDPASYARFSGRDYVPDLAIEKALQFVRDNQNRPFFLYYPTTIPHLALQVPDDALKPYLGKWDDPPYVGDKGYLPNQHPRAAYAAMVTRLDQHVGRILQLLDELSLADNTIVVFTSDNGPTYNRLGGSDSDFFESAGAFRGLKGSMYEGGIRVPLVARYPGHIAAGATSDRLSGFEDWIPTLLDLVGAHERIPAAGDGISMMPTLLGQKQPARAFLYREFSSYGGQQAVWLGQYKGIRQRLVPNRQNPAAKPNMHLALYDLASDPGEKQDISTAHQDLVARMEAILKEQHVNSKQFPLPALDGPAAARK